MSPPNARIVSLEDALSSRLKVTTTFIGCHSFPVPLPTGHEKYFDPYNLQLVRFSDGPEVSL